MSPRWFVGVLMMLQLVSAQPPGPHIFVSSPNVIRVGNTETVLINVFNTEPVEVTITLKNADQSEICPSQTVTVNQVNPQIIHLAVDPERVQLPVSEDDEIKLYAKLGVACPALSGFNQERDVLISYEEGFVFIQTDKPIYTPAQTVSIRLLILDQFLRPSDQEVQMDVLTPQGVIVHRKPKSTSENGFKTHIFRFPAEPLLGNWSVVASYGKDLRSNRSVQFEVREYVLPTFSVVLTTPEYILEGEERLLFNVRARYVYNKPVIGTFEVKVGIMEDDGEVEIKEKILGELLGDGVGAFEIMTSQFGDNWFEENVDKRLYVEVKVLELATGFSETVSDTSAKFVRSPYIFKWDRTIQHYKKGLPYHVKVDLLFANGKPAPGVLVNVAATGYTSDRPPQQLIGEENPADQVNAPLLSRTNYKGQVNFRLYVPIDCNKINVTLETRDEDLIREDGPGNNAIFEFDVDPYVSPSDDDFILIRFNEGDIQTDDTVLVEILKESNDPIPWLGYYLVSKGQILRADVIRNALGVQGFPLPVTFDMVPSARLVAFYIHQNGHVIADSVWMHVQQRECQNDVQVSVANEIDRDIPPPLKPGRNVDLRVTANRGSSTTVGLLAVDKAVLLLRDYHRLTSDKMFKTMDTYDTGCGPGGGGSTSEVFQNAGIMVVSSATIDVERREDYGCDTPLNARRRRSINRQMANQLEDYKQNPNETFACRRGHRQVGPTSDCQQRRDQFSILLARRIPGLDRKRKRELLRIFVACCKVAANHTSRERSGGQFGAGIDDIADFAEPANTRSDFRETWIFEEVQVGEDGSVQQAFTIPSSLTQWSISAVGLSELFPMCVAEPLNLYVTKEFFIQLHMPYSVVRKEQVEILATIFNYEDVARDLRVFLRTPKEICSEGNSGVYSAMKKVRVEANNAVTVRYIIIGLKIGEYPIEVAAYSTGPQDAVRKMLKVEPEGFETSLEFVSELDPTGSGREDPLDRRPRSTVINSDQTSDVFPDDSKQIDRFNISLPDGLVPNSEKCELNVIGSIMGPAVMSVIENLGDLLAIPGGCGEQTMIGLTPNVYVLHYLENLDAATEELETRAKNNIKNGILHEMTHRKSDGSYGVYVHTTSKTWLTAFVIKVFCHASEIENIFVEPQSTCRTLEWLIDTSQRADGAFYETNARSGSLQGAMQGDAAFTAFVLISLHECECATLISKLYESTSRATEFLVGQLDTIDRPYTMAIVTYALALVNSGEKNRANNKLKAMASFDSERGLRFWGTDGVIDSTNKPAWYQGKVPAFTVETTGYALLAQLALEDVEYSHSIARWLSGQQNYGGGFRSTQDTTLALQALSQYSIQNKGEDINMTCSVEYDSMVRSKFEFDKDNALIQRREELPEIRPLEVTSIGRGKGKLNVKVTYNTISTDLDERGCPFEMVINSGVAPPEPPPRGDNPGPRRPQGEEDPLLNLRVSVEVGYLRDTPTNMAIIDIGIFTGYKPETDDLDQIVEQNQYISRYEISQRSVIFYADLIPHVDQLPKLRVQFRVRRVFNVGNLQPVAVKVYDYYSPSEKCVRFYHPSSNKEAARTLANICEGEFCVCAAGDCFDCGPNPKGALLNRSCESAQTYVYKIMITQSREEASFMVYTAVIIQVLKPADDIIRLDDTREFWVSSSCSECIDRLKDNTWHLVIGKTVLPYVTKDNHHSFKYILDNSALMEFWPQRSKRKFRPLIEKLNQFEADMLEGRNNCQ